MCRSLLMNIRYVAKWKYNIHNSFSINIQCRLLKDIPYNMWTIRFSWICTVSYLLFMNIHYKLFTIHEYTLHYSLFRNIHYPLFTIHEGILFIIHYEFTLYFIHSQYVLYIIHYLWKCKIHHKLFMKCIIYNFFRLLQIRLEIYRQTPDSAGDFNLSGRCQ